MQSVIHEERRDGYLLSSDPARLDVAWVHGELSTSSYWAQGRTLEAHARLTANSLNFGLYREGAAAEGAGAEIALPQVGYARLVTDYVAFGWLADVWIAEGARGQGLGKWLVRGLLRHPDVAALGRIMLGTRDAHALYTFEGGFVPLPNPERFLIRARK